MSRRAPRAAPVRCRLVCFPHAGGAASAFAGWGDLLPAEVEVLAVALPGRDGDSDGVMPRRLPDLLADLAVAIAPLGDVPVILFGHSWGAILAYEVALALLHTTSWSVDHLVVAAAVAPHVPLTLPRLSDLSRSELLGSVAGLGGIPATMLAEDRYLDLVEPALRADLRMAADYVPRPRRPLPCPITVLGGAEDPLTPVADLDAWRAYTSVGCRRILMEGDHFFVASARRHVIGALEALLPSGAHRRPLTGTRPDA